MGARSDRAIAVVGMAGRFPGAASVAELWEAVVAGRESLTRFTPAQLETAGVSPADYRNPQYVPVRGVLSDVELFDATLFGYAPRDAEITDPQQRLLLECAWQALESAGYTGAGCRIGVFAGTSINTYFLRHVMVSPELERTLGLLPLVLANEKDHVATRLAYKLGLAGPAVTVQTACSTSLTAVHLACRSLLAGEAEIALAGGACVQLPQQAGYLFDPNGIVSADGHCRAFDRRAQGTVPGNGVALVVLKPLEAAARDRDTIHAVILGSAINNDAGRKAGYTAPSIAGQADVVQAALVAAGVSADTIGYVQAHGTGTELGDGVEIAALTEAFRATTNRTGYCAVGSLKATIGHLDAAAGVAGLIAGVLAVREAILPPSINCDEANPEIDWTGSPFFVNTVVRRWDAPVRRCGVSSFGMGGTNVHLVLEQPPALARGSGGAGPALLLASGHTREAARQVATRLAARLTEPAAPVLPDVALTSQRGRVHLEWRTAVVAGDATTAGTELIQQEPNRAGRSPSVVMLFSGQGAQYPGMARTIYQTYPLVREHIDEAADRLAGLLGVDLRELVLAPGGAADGKAAAKLRRTRLAQPALFLVATAVFRQLSSWGIRARAVVGHSSGELAAAYAAGVLSLHDGLHLVAQRAKLMDRCAPGSMLAVLAAQPDVSAFLDAEVTVAAVNAPEVVVIAGPSEAVDRVDASLRGAGIMTRRLHVSHAFHSAMMEPIVEEFRRAAAPLRFHPPHTRMISNVTGDVLNTYGADYWADQLRQPIQFSAAVHRAARLPDPVFLEVGPGHTLTALVEQQDPAGRPRTIGTLPGPGEQAGDLLPRAVADLWCAGVDLDFAAFNPADGAGRVVLPDFPFQRSRFWIDPPRPTPSTPDSMAVSSTADRLTSAASAAGPPVADHPAPPEPGAAGRGVVEVDIDAELAGLWIGLLGIGVVADETNFFEVGGQSLLAVRLVSGVRRRIGAQLALGDVLRAATFGAQKEVIRRLLGIQPVGAGKGSGVG